MLGNNYLLWEDDEFLIKTPVNPHIPYSEGFHIIVTTKDDLETAWSNPATSGKAFELAAKVCRVAEDLGISPWFNIQANGNWGLLSGGKKFFHIHVYGRNKTSGWGKPISLPEEPGTYSNESMPKQDRQKLSEALKAIL